jgi:hypothetical protein
VQPSLPPIAAQAGGHRRPQGPRVGAPALPAAAPLARRHRRRCRGQPGAPSPRSRVRPLARTPAHAPLPPALRVPRHRRRPGLHARHSRRHPLRRARLRQPGAPGHGGRPQPHRRPGAGHDGWRPLALRPWAPSGVASRREKRWRLTRAPRALAPGEPPTPPQAFLTPGAGGELPAGQGRRLAPPAGPGAPGPRSCPCPAAGRGGGRDSAPPGTARLPSHARGRWRWSSPGGRRPAARHPRATWGAAAPPPRRASGERGARPPARGPTGRRGCPRGARAVWSRAATWDAVVGSRGRRGAVEGRPRNG